MRLAVAVLGLLPATGALTGALPTRVGTCAPSAIRWIGQRLEDGLTHQPIPGSGSAVSFANHGYQVSYAEVAAIARPGLAIGG